MDCDQTRERLPWLLNGGLEPGEAERCEAHLAGCAGCREERARAQLAARLFATHPTPADLVAHAFSDLDDPGRALVQAHLDSCAACREEAALVAASREDMTRPQGRARAPGRALPGGTRLLAAAAVVAALLAAGGWMATWQRLRSAEAGARQREAALERRIEELASGSTSAPPAAAASPAPAAADGERIAALEGELVRLRQPSAALAVVELLPDELVVRGAGTAPPALAADRPATLLLVAEGIAAGGTYRLRIGAPAPLWDGEARAARAGELALHLPAGSLPAGRHRLEVRSATGETVASYRLEVR